MSALQLVPAFFLPLQVLHRFVFVRTFESSYDLASNSMLAIEATQLGRRDELVREAAVEQNTAFGQSSASP